MSYSAFYRKELTDVSFTELKKLLNWINSKDVTPTIIGGWAVYAYEEGLGSRDIDIVIPDLSVSGDIYRKEYFEKNDYVPKFLNYKIKKFEKTIPNMQGDDIIVDVFDGNSEREELFDLKVKFDWRWMLEIREKKFIGDLEMFVPKRELLIVIKIIAALSRSKEYDRLGNSRLPAKIWKDYHDVASLSIRKDLNKPFLEEYIAKSHLEQYMDDFLSKYRIDAYEDIRRNFEFGYEEIQSTFKLR